MTPKSARSRAAAGADAWNLKVYVAGRTPKSMAAFVNLKKICEEHLQGQYHIEIIDLIKQPQLAKGDQIPAVPTLAGLDLRPQD